MASVYKRGSIWWLSYYFNGHRVRKKIGKSKKIAELALSDIELKLAGIQAGFIDPKITITTFLKDTQDRINRKAPTTRLRYSNVLKYFSQFISPVKIRYITDINSAHINAYINFRLSSGMHTNTINYDLARLHSFFRYYIENNQLQISPIKAVTKFSKIHKIPRYLSDEEIPLLFQNLKERYKPFFITLLYTGMRRDELLHLTWNDVKDSVLYVRSKPDWSPKTKSSTRQIPLHKEVISAIQQRRSLKESTSLVFSTETGGPITASNLNYYLRLATQKTGIKNVSVHTFRHTFASHLVQKGVSIYLVSKLLGHSSVQQTEIYAHLSPNPNYEIINTLVFDL